MRMQSRAAVTLATAASVEAGLALVLFLLWDRVDGLPALGLGLAVLVLSFVAAVITLATTAHDRSPPPPWAPYEQNGRPHEASCRGPRY